MFEKVNPSHPDKVADRIAGALVDMAYAKQDRPRIAVEVLLGHGSCFIISETSVELEKQKVKDVVKRIAGDELTVGYREFPQDVHLAGNQSDGLRCGDNGIFKGCPVTEEQRKLSEFMRDLYELYPYDGKAVADGASLTLCQSNANTPELEMQVGGYPIITCNPLGNWTGGTDVDSGATNRKLGSDMGDAITGGGLHGKDLSKADVSVNIVCHIMAQAEGCEVTASCAIADQTVKFDLPGDRHRRLAFSGVVNMAGQFVARMGGFERLAEWGLV